LIYSVIEPAMMELIASAPVFGGRMELAPDKYKWIGHNDQ
jgi:hypothetical protein